MVTTPGGLRVSDRKAKDNMKKILFFKLLVFSILLAACDPEEDLPNEVMGLRPIYGTAADLEVRALPAREICNPGKIYVYGAYLLINELHQGIHIIDNADPSQPRNLSFIRIVGNVDMAVKNNYLYADHLTSLVVFDISDPEKAKFIKAVENTFDYGSGLYPPVEGVRFECVDPAKGPVIGWVEAMLKDPKCYR